MERVPELQQFLDDFAIVAEIPDGVVVAAEHVDSCRCSACFEFWSFLGNDKEGYGPFTRQEIEKLRKIGPVKHYINCVTYAGGWVIVHHYTNYKMELCHGVWAAIEPYGNFYRFVVGDWAVLSESVAPSVMDAMPDEVLAVYLAK